MDDKKISFLIEIDRDLKLLNIYWNNPIYLISPYQIKLTDIFEKKDKVSLKVIIDKSFTNKNNVIGLNGYSPLNVKENIILNIFYFGGNLFIYGVEENDDLEIIYKNTLENIIYNFLEMLDTSRNLALTENTLTIRSQFEKVQKLNNELVNTQRRLKKANIQLKQLNEVLNNRLVKDSLTGLVSRYQYREEIEITIKKDVNKLGIFVFLDIDDFKSVNDNYGHNIGDIYLREFADRLNKLKFSNTVCMRISGDEFGIYIHGYNKVTDEDINHIWCEIQEEVLKTIEIDRLKLKVSCSVGMAVYGIDTREIYNLIEYADFAMYRAKKTGKNGYRRFDIEEYKTNKNFRF